MIPCHENGKSDILGRTIEPQCTNSEVDICIALFPRDLHVTWAPYAFINITWDQFQHRNTRREQLSDDFLYHLNIERVRLVNNRRDLTAFVARHQTIFQVSFLIFVITAVLPVFWKFALKIFLHADFLTHKCPLLTRPLLIFDEFWESRISHYAEDV